MDKDCNWVNATRAGGLFYDNSANIVVDPRNGNLFVIGVFSDTATFGTVTLTANGTQVDVFVAKLDANLNWLCANKADGAGTDYGYGITIDPITGDVFVTGGFDTSITFGTYTLTSGFRSIFVAKMDSENCNWLCANKGSGYFNDSLSIAVDSVSHDVFITGYFDGSVTFNTITLNTGTRAIFVAKLDKDCNWLCAVSAGGPNLNRGNSIAVSKTGDVFITGQIQGSVEFGSTTLTPNPFNNEIFVAKLDKDCNWLNAVMSYSNASTLNSGLGIAINSETDDIVITGYIQGSVEFGSTTLNSTDITVFVANLDENLNWLCANQGVSTDSRGNNVAIDTTSNTAYTIGFFRDTLTFDQLTLSDADSYNVFVSKFNTCKGILPPDPPNPEVPCFLEGTKILCYKNQKETYLQIQDLKEGTLVKTLENGYLPVKLIGHSKLYNSGDNRRIDDRLYTCSKEDYSTLTEEDLVLTGGHSILVNSLTDEQRAKTIKKLGKLYITDSKYRLLASVDEKTTPYDEKGVFNIWHIVLDDDEFEGNHGIYANGLLVESCFENDMRDNMNIV